MGRHGDRRDGPPPDAGKVGPIYFDAGGKTHGKSTLYSLRLLIIYLYLFFKFCYILFLYLCHCNSFVHLVWLFNYFGWMTMLMSTIFKINSPNLILGFL